MKIPGKLFKDNGVDTAIDRAQLEEAIEQLTEEDFDEIVELADLRKKLNGKK